MSPQTPLERVVSSGSVFAFFIGPTQAAFNGKARPGFPCRLMSWVAREVLCIVHVIVAYTLVQRFGVIALATILLH